jgi:putative glutamine amidotransferase
MKLIGIPARVMNTGGIKEYINQNYLDELQKYRLFPLLLTTKNINQINLLTLCNGFLIPGGDDIDPSYFNEVNAGKSLDINLEVDELDKIIINWAVKEKKPLLGICRGIQAINVFMGGSIYQDIGKSHQHIISNHKVKTYPNRLLNFKKLIDVNSYHHQAINVLSNGFKVIAKHVDGTIEAIIHDSLPILGIQWHPELLPESKETRIIFDAFLKLINLKNS